MTSKKKTPSSTTTAKSKLSFAKISKGSRNGSLFLSKNLFMLAYLKKIHREAFRFIIVGVLATGIHYGVYYLLLYWMTPNPAYTSGYCISLIFNFILSNCFTFQTKPTVGKSIKFLLSHGINYLLHIGLFNLFLSLSIPKEIAPLFVFAIAIPVNFILVRLSLKGREKKESNSDSTH